MFYVFTTKDLRCMKLFFVQYKELLEPNFKK